MTKLAERTKKIILYISAAVRVSGVIAFLFFHPFIAYLINTLFDMADGPVHKHILKLKPETAQLLDKVFDLWLYTAAVTAAATTSYQLPATNYLIILYFYRLTGQIVFFATKNKRLLVYFPNLFENFFFLFTFLDLISANQLLKKPIFLLGSIIILVGFKISHEVSLHYRGETVFDNIILPIFKKNAN